jgi:hypothetical protein
MVVECADRPFDESWTQARDVVVEEEQCAPSGGPTQQKTEISLDVQIAMRTNECARKTGSRERRQLGKSLACGEVDDRVPRVGDAAGHGQHSVGRRATAADHDHRHVQRDTEPECGQQI